MAECAMGPSDKITLRDGISIPCLGVYRMGRGRVTESAVHWALEAGDRHIDAVSMYGNETEVSKLTEAHRDALARRDHHAINLLQDKISLLMELRDELIAKPPGITGSPVH